MSDYFGQGDNGSLEKLKMLLQMKRGAIPNTPPPSTPLPSAPLPMQQLAPIKPAKTPDLSPADMQELEDQKKTLDEGNSSSEDMTMNKSDDDQNPLLQMIRARMQD